MNISPADFTKMTLNDVSDLLLSDITDTKKQSTALLYGSDQDGRLYKLSVELSIDE